ncbi:DUF2057 domain-containing protein [Seminibacterium arietis]|uniref:UPF0319 protein ACFQ02_00920 n=1 Tax=Seminibacterium arietis TaxID=1173502 RepID=A0ABW3I711_9PAST
MKLSSIALTTVTLFYSTISVAGLVSSSSNIDFLVIDGQKANKSFLKNTNAFNADENKIHQVVLRVSEVVKSSSDRTLFESAPIIVTFQGVNEDLVLSTPKLETQRDVDIFSKSPNITATTVSGNKIDIKQDMLKQEGFLPNANILESLSEYNASNSIASVPSFASSSVLPATGFTKLQKNKVTLQGDNVAEQQLQFWFLQADKNTQSRFLDWAKKQK